MSKIISIKAREILDSRGNPTVEVDVITKDGISRAAVPSGASTGIHEAVELRDGGKRYLGKGVKKAVRNVNTVLAGLVKGKDPAKQKIIDDIMIAKDSTRNKSRLGANAILGVSMAVCRAGAKGKKKPLYRHIADLAGLSGNKALTLPIPFFNVINGGRHAGNKLAVQEYMIAPVNAASFSAGLRMCSEVYHILKGIIEKKYGKNACNVGDEGGFAPPVRHIEEPLRILVLAIKRSGYHGKVKIAMDCAASEFYNRNKKAYRMMGRDYHGTAMITIYKHLVKKYPLISIEDPFSEDDWNNFFVFNKLLGSKVQIVGDDLTVTNPARLEEAIAFEAANALLLKLNQIGTVSEALQAAAICRDHGWNVMVSHRSGETSDNFISDLAVGLGSGQIKSGALSRSERLSKYNQLLRIEEELGKNAVYAGHAEKKLFSG